MSDIKKYSVLQVLPHLNSGGLVSGAIEISLSLINNNFNSYVLTKGGRREREIVRAGGILFKMNVASKNPIVMFKNIFKIIKIIKDYKIDIIHTRSRAPAWSAYFAAKKMNIPFITTFHGTYGINNRIKKIYNSIMVRGDKVIAISAFIKNHIISNYNVDEDRVETIPRGIDISVFNSENVSNERLIYFTNKFNIMDNSYVILLPGRITRWKGHILLIKAIAELKRKDLLCIFVGDSQGRTKYVAELHNLINKYELSDKFRIVENQIDMSAIYKLSDIVISASTDPEAFGRVIAEAQAMGRLTIAADHGGASEIIVDGVTGWLFEANNSSALAKKIDYALNISLEDRNIMAINSVERIKKNFNNKFMSLRTIKVYKDILSKLVPDEK